MYRKNLKYAVLILLVLGLTFSVSAQPVDGFEDGDYTSSPSWTALGSGTVSVTSDSNSIDGTYSVLLDTDGTNQFPGLRKNLDNQVTHGQIYSIEAYNPGGLPDIRYGFTNSGNEFWSGGNDVQLEYDGSQFSGEATSNDFQTSVSMSSDSVVKLEMEMNLDNDEVIYRIYDDGVLQDTQTLSYSGDPSNYDYIKLNNQDSPNDIGGFYIDNVAYDEEPNPVPTIDNINAEPSTLNQGESVNISAEITDDSTVDSAELTITDSTSSVQLDSQDMTAGSGDLYFYEYTTSINAEPGAWDAEINATDNEGASVQDNVNFTVEVEADANIDNSSFVLEEGNPKDDIGLNMSVTNNTAVTGVANITNVNDSNQFVTNSVMNYQGNGVFELPSVELEGWKDNLTYTVWVYENADATNTLDTDSATQYFENSDLEYSIEKDGEDWSDWNQTQLSEDTEYGPFTFTVNNTHEYINATRVLYSVTAYNVSGTNNTIIDGVKFLQEDSIQEDNSFTGEFWWGDATFCPSDACIENVTGYENVRLDFTTSLFDDTQTGIKDSYTRSSYHMQETTTETLLNRLFDFLDTLISPVVNLLSGILDALWSVIVWLFEGVLKILIAIADFIAQLIGYILVIVSNSIQYVIFYHTEIDYDYDNQTYDMLNETGASTLELLEGDVTISSGGNQSEHIEGSYALQPSESTLNDTLLTYRRDITLFSYEFGAIEEPDETQDNDSEYYVNDATMADYMVNNESLDRYTPYGSGSQDLDPIPVHVGFNNDVDNLFGGTEPTGSVSGSMGYVDGDSRIRTQRDAGSQVISYGSLWNLTDTTFELPSNPSDGDMYTTSFNVTVGGSATDPRAVFIIYTDSPNRNVILEPDDTQGNVSLKYESGSNTWKSIYTRDGTTTTQDLGVRIQSGDELTLGLGTAIENDAIDSSTANWYYWETNLTVADTSHDFTHLSKSEIRTAKEEGDIDNNELSVELPFPKLFDPMGIPPGVITIINILILIFGAIIGIIPDPIKQAFATFISMISTIVELITLIISYTVWAVDWALNEGRKIIVEMIYLGVLVKGAHYVILYNNSDMHPSEALNMIIDDIINLFDTAVNLVAHTVRVVNELVDILVTIANTIRGMIRGL